MTVRISKKLFLFLSIICITLSSYMGENAYADYADLNFDTDYELIITDEADLLSDDEERKLAEKMYEITRYGNVGFYSSDEINSSTENLAKRIYNRYFGCESGVIFVIDMYNREIYFWTDGKIGDYLTEDYCYTIADNIYKKATKKDYYGCAYKGYDQVNALLEGRKIAQPMKYISNTLLAVCLGMIVTYLIALLLSKGKKATTKEEVASMMHSFYIINPSVVFTHQTKKYDPPSSSSSGGGGGGGGGGGHGGGHSF